MGNSLRPPLPRLPASHHPSPSLGSSPAAVLVASSPRPRSHPRPHSHPPMPDTPSHSDPLQRLLRSLEQIRDACYVCDRAPLDDMIDDLRRWAAQLAPEVEVPTVQERGKVREGGKR